MTSSSPTIIILSDQLWGLSRGTRLERCQACNVKFKKRDSEIVRKGSGKNSSKWYHIKCAKLKNII